MPRFASGPSDYLFGLTVGAKLRADALQFFSQTADTFGDIAMWRVGGWRMALVNHPRYVREVLVNQRDRFPKLPQHTQVLRAVANDNLFVAEGDDWLRRRRLVQPAFHPQRMQAYGKQVDAAVKQQLDKWMCGQSVDLAAALARLTQAVIARMLFSLEMREDGDVLIESVHALSEAAIREMGAVVNVPDWLPLPYKRRKRRAIAAQRALIDGLIAERKGKTAEHDDVLSMLLDAADDEGDGQKMTAAQARGEALLMFNAGQGDTAGALGWTCFELAQRPHLQEAIASEVNEAAGGEPCSAAHVKDMPLLDRVIKESLRLHPPTWCFTARQATEDVDLGDVTLPKGCWVFICPYVLHRHPKLFDEPLVFDEQRFLPQREDAIEHMAYIPFGGGPRICIGQRFATLVVKLTLAAIVQRFHLGEPEAEVQPNPTISLRLDPGLPVTLSHRKLA